MTILNSSIDAFVNQILSEWNSPGGISIAVVQRNPDTNSWQIETKGYGVAKMDGSSVTPKTLFSIASNSKIFTAIAIGFVPEKSPRSLIWDTKLAELIPEWKLMDPVAGSETNVLDALSHRTGLPRHDLMYGRDETVKSIVNSLQYLKPSTSFRNTWQYTNIMYTVISHLNTIIHGMPIAQIVKNRIFDPLGMNSTTYSYDKAERTGNLAHGFGRFSVKRSEDPFEKGVPCALEFPSWDLDNSENGYFNSGAGGIITNAEDAAIWLQTLLIDGRNPETDEQVIPEEVLQKVIAGVSVLNPTPEYAELSPKVYGCGQVRYSYRGHDLLEHGGDIIGFASQIARLPNDNFGIAIFSNDDLYGQRIVEIVKYRIIDEFLGLDPINWNEREKSAVLKDSNLCPVGMPYRLGVEILARNSHPTRKLVGCYNQASDNVSIPYNPSFLEKIPANLYSGKYYNPAYGKIELHLVSNAGSFNVTQNEKNIELESLRKEALEIPSSLLRNPNSNTPRLISKWEKFWSSHLVFDYIGGSTFRVTPINFQPILDSDKSYITNNITAKGKDIRAKFIFSPTDTDDGRNIVGFGIVGGIWGAGDGVSDLNNVLYEGDGEVWFSRE